MQVEGLLSAQSRADFADTVEQLLGAIEAGGLTVFARIDHAAGAAAAGLTLRPTQLLIFGTARGGTPLMQAQQLLGIELPLRALVWQDAALNTWISWPDVKWLAQRYALPQTAAEAVTKLAALLKGLVQQATGAAAQEAELDEELEDSFPASDPLPWSHDSR